MTEHEGERVQQLSKKGMDVDRNTKPEDHAPGLVEEIQKAAQNSLAAWEVPFSDLEVFYIRELAENVYTLRFMFNTALVRGHKTQEQGIYVGYFGNAFYLESDTLARFAKHLVGVDE